MCVIGSGTVSMIYAALACLEGAARVIMIVRSDDKKRLVRQVLGDKVAVYVSPSYPEAASPETLAVEGGIE